MFDKTIFVLKNKLTMISDNDLIFKCLDNNYLIASLAREELVSRHPVYLNFDDEVLLKIIDKLSIEQIYELAITNVDTRLCILAYNRLLDILDEYDRIHEDRKRREKIYLFK